MEMMNFEIVPLIESLLESAADLEKAVFSEPWSLGALGILLKDDAVGFACLRDGELLGYGGMQIVLDEGQITNIGVYPAARRQGVGYAIFSALIDEARRRGLAQIVLEVRVSNLAAIALYEKLGFSTVGTRKRFYRQPVEDAFVMLKQL